MDEIPAAPVVITEDIEELPAEEEISEAPEPIVEELEELPQTIEEEFEEIPTLEETEDIFEAPEPIPEETEDTFEAPEPIGEAFEEVPETTEIIVEELEEIPEEPLSDFTLDVAPYSITDEELEAMFNDPAPEDVEEKAAEPEDEIAEDVTEEAEESEETPDEAEEAFTEEVTADEETLDEESIPEETEAEPAEAEAEAEEAAEPAEAEAAELEEEEAEDEEPAAEETAEEETASEEPAVAIADGIAAAPVALEAPTAEETAPEELAEEAEAEAEAEDEEPAAEEAAEEPSEEEPAAETEHSLEDTVVIGMLPIVGEKATETITIGTDETWGYYASDIAFSGIHAGEEFNRLLWEEKENPEKNAVVLDLDVTLVPRTQPAVIVYDRRRPENVILTEEGDRILDFGRCFTGFVTFESALEKGTRVELSFAKELTEEGFRADTDERFIYVSDGIPEIAGPHFACFTGRYVKVTGWAGEFDPNVFTACAIGQETERTGILETADQKINGYCLDVLESFNSVEAKAETNEIPYASYVVNNQSEFEEKLASEDVQTELQADLAFKVWDAYQMYGDEAFLAAQYENMKAWTDHVDAEDGKHPEKLYLCANPETACGLPKSASEKDCEFIASAYYFGAAETVSKAAKELEKEEDAFYYSRLARKIKQAVLEEYFTGTGRFAVDTEAALITALRFGLYVNKEKIAKALENALKQNPDAAADPSLKTCAVLTENGMEDLAYDLLLNSESAGGEEAVRFLYRYAAGLQPAEAGFQSVRLAPLPNGKLGSLRSRYRLENGVLTSNWTVREDGSLNFHFEIPEGTEARVVLPYYPVCAAYGNEMTVHSGSFDYAYMPSKKMIPEEQESVNE